MSLGDMGSWIGAIGCCGGRPMQEPNTTPGERGTSNSLDKSISSTSTPHTRRTSTPHIISEINNARSGVNIPGLCWWTETTGIGIERGTEVLARGEGMLFHAVHYMGENSPSEREQPKRPISSIAAAWKTKANAQAMETAFPEGTTVFYRARFWNSNMASMRVGAVIDREELHLAGGQTITDFHRAFETIGVQSIDKLRGLLEFGWTWCPENQPGPSGRLLEPTVVTFWSSEAARQSGKKEMARIYAQMNVASLFTHGAVTFQSTPE